MRPLEFILTLNLPLEALWLKPMSTAFSVQNGVKYFLRVNSVAIRFKASTAP